MYRLRPVAACLAHRNYSLAVHGYHRVISTLGQPAAAARRPVPLVSSGVYRHPACHRGHRNVHTEPEPPADKLEGSAPLETRQPRSLHKNTERDLWEVCVLWLIRLTSYTDASDYTGAFHSYHALQPWIINRGRMQRTIDTHLLHMLGPLTHTQAVRIVRDDNCSDVVTIDVRARSSTCDFFVIATCRAKRHMQAVADELQQKVCALRNARVFYLQGRHIFDFFVRSRAALQSTYIHKCGQSGRPLR